MDITIVPKKLNIFGKTIKIVVTELDENLGEFNIDKREIRLDITQTNKQAVETLRHEVFHALLQLSGYAFKLKSKEEESLVRTLEYGTEDLFYFKFEK